MRPPPMNPAFLPPLYTSLYPHRNPRKSPYRRESPWALVYWDNRYVLYLKKIPRFMDIIERDGYHYADPVMTNRYFEGLANDPERTAVEKTRAQAAFAGLRLPPVWRRR